MHLLQYAPNLDHSTVTGLEAARRAGAAQDCEIELIGQDSDTAKAFLAAVQDGSVAQFMPTVLWKTLEHKRGINKQPLPKHAIAISVF